MKHIRIGNSIPYLAKEYARSIQQQNESKNSRAGTEIDVIILFSVKSAFARYYKEMNIQKNTLSGKKKKQTTKQNQRNQQKPNHTY